MISYVPQYHHLDKLAQQNNGHKPPFSGDWIFFPFCSFNLLAYLCTYGMCTGMSLQRGKTDRSRESQVAALFL